MGQKTAINQKGKVSNDSQKYICNTKDKTQKETTRVNSKRAIMKKGYIKSIGVALVNFEIF